MTKVTLHYIAIDGSWQTIGLTIRIDDVLYERADVLMVKHLVKHMVKHLLKHEDLAWISA